MAVKRMKLISGLGLPNTTKQIMVGLNGGCIIGRFQKTIEYTVHRFVLYFNHMLLFLNGFESGLVLLFMAASHWLITMKGKR